MGSKSLRRPGQNHRRPILTLTGDTAGGVHQILMAGCDRYRYRELGHEGYYDNCTGNLTAGLAVPGLKAPETPSPLSLFMNTPWTGPGDLSFDPPVSAPRGFAVPRAKMDLVIAFSACPRDILPIDGTNEAPAEALFAVFEVLVCDLRGK